MSAEQLALQLDRVVNNLSLVLAFEFVDSSEVLLFAADAQIGNWLSWQGLCWKIKDGGGDQSLVTSNELLAHTVFYKVGHHGSHNATLMNEGLERMVHPELVAAIPVDQDFANNTKNWDMPATSLYPHLIEKTKGRILRSDGKGATSSNSDADESTKQWKKFAARVSVDKSESPLYVDYFVP